MKRKTNAKFSTAKPKQRQVVQLTAPTPPGQLPKTTPYDPENKPKYIA